MSAQLEILGGTDRHGRPEDVMELTLLPGESLAVVGPTGSGKSEFLADIEQLARRDTPSGRQVRFGGSNVESRSGALVATLSQRTHFIMDASVHAFVTMHAAALRKSAPNLSEQVVELANTLCGEPMSVTGALQRLSGGQARALMIADIARISDAPVVLIDEVENAGIDKHRAVKTLAGHGKIIITATHDPVLMLSSQRRIVMAGGGMRRLLELDAEEQVQRDELARLDNLLLRARDALRAGQRLDNSFSLPSQVAAGAHSVTLEGHNA